MVPRNLQQGIQGFGFRVWSLGGDPLGGSRLVRTGVRGREMTVNISGLCAPIWGRHDSLVQRMNLQVVYQAGVPLNPKR